MHDMTRFEDPDALFVRNLRTCHRQTRWSQFSLPAICSLLRNRARVQQTEQLVNNCFMYVLESRTQ